tara:strand:+ start:410 stop:733 length:324 start_codon:yes stop_codon:yes gene_type:complete
MTFTWTVDIPELVSWNKNSRQRDIIRQVSFTIRGTDDRGHYSEAGGCIAFDDNNLSGSFSSVEDITDAQLQSWVETFLGADRIQEMKDEITTTIQSLPDDWVAAPEG